MAKKGAQPTDTVRSLLKRAGVLEKWHMIRTGKDVTETEPVVESEQPEEISS